MDDQNLTTLLRSYLIDSGMDAGAAHLINFLVNVVVLAIVVYLCYYFTKNVVIRVFKALTQKTKTTFDDFLVTSNFPIYIGTVLPLVVLVYALPFVFSEYPGFLSFSTTLIDLYTIVLVVLIFRSILRSLKNYLKTKEQFKDKPVDSFIQVLMIIIWGVGLIFIFSELSGKEVGAFLISLGAASAIILLVFKDTILGFVASIQVSANDTVRIGDWISFSKYGADGYVTEINLATVKVQNWDKTITTIPTYSLISDSFQNWRGMEESPGRRIKRSLYIKQNSVRFVTSEDLKRFEKFSLIAPYLKERQQEIDTFNENHAFDRSTVLNGRNQTNLGIFRKYANAYLEAHPGVTKELTFMVRHLAPTPHGIPLEIYCFSNDKRWVHYEDIQANIFDHLMAALPYFDLRLFEEPSGDDLLKLSEKLQPRRE